MTADQHGMWNHIHAEAGLGQQGLEPSEFARAVAPKIPHSSKLLELGCGRGGDAAYFAGGGCSIVATDFSDVVIAQNTVQFPEIDFRVLDMTRPLPFGDREFDVVYANLSLHCYDDNTTHAIFREIARVLAPNGQLFYRCKSVHSQLEKQSAVEIGPNIYDKDGHLYHLFSTEYAKDVASGLFRLDHSEYTEGDAYGYEAYFVEVEATKL